jgi:hypothetical protein
VFGRPLFELATSPEEISRTDADLLLNNRSDRVSAWVGANAELSPFTENDYRREGKATASAPESVSHGLVFIDDSVRDAQTLLTGLEPGLEVVQIRDDTDGIAQITAALAGRTGLSSLHVIAHGDAGDFHLGDTLVNSQTLDANSQLLQSWATALTPDADILLYSCNTAATQTGEQFANELSQLTGADVAASSDLTGNSAKGGDWTLEYTTGAIESPLAFQLGVLNAYIDVLAEYIVTNTANNGPGSLRNAMEQSTANPGADTISFNIPTTDPGYVPATASVQAHWSIAPFGALPSIGGGGPVTIDATTQPGFNGNPVIELNGSFAGNAFDFSNGFFILGGSDNVIKGFAINRFYASGIRLVGTSNNIIQGNYIGTDVSGTIALGNSASRLPRNDHGICINNSNDNLIGGTGPGEGNLVSGNINSGIVLFDEENSDSNRVIGNKVGTDVTGTRALPNARYGIFSHAFNTLIQGNLVSGNGSNPGALPLQGIFTEYATRGNQVLDNLVGTDITGTQPLGNFGYGVFVLGSDHTVRNNTVAFNAQAGLFVQDDFRGDTNNRVTQNSIFDNGGLGIGLKLGPQSSQFDYPQQPRQNDLGDGDGGANNYQNYPILQSAQVVGDNTNVTGTFNSIPNTTFRIEFFSSTSLSVTGNGEGQTYLGFTNVRTDANGNARVNFSIPEALQNRFITATALDPNGNTSEFSNSVGVDSLRFGFSRTNYIINENGTLNGIFEPSGEFLPIITLVRAGDISSEATVDVELVPGTATVGTNFDPGVDFINPSQTVTFAPGERSTTFEVVVINDPLVEGDENFTLRLADPSGSGAVTENTANVIIRDNDIGYTVTPSTPTVLEGDTDSTPVSFTIARTGRVDLGGSVNFAIGGSAADGIDYSNVNVTGTGVSRNGNTIIFGSGAASATITLNVLGNTLVEPDRTIEVTLSNPTSAGGTGSLLGGPGTLTILDDDLVPTITIGDATFAEGNDGTTQASFTVTLSDPISRVVRVNYSTSNGTATAESDYEAIAPTLLTFNPGETSKTITVAIDSDTTNEPDETFNVNLSSPSNATLAKAIGVGTISNDDPEPTITLSDATATEGNGSFTEANFTLTLSNPSSRAITVGYATSDGTATTADSDYNAMASTLTINPGETRATISVIVNGDTKFEPDETFNLTLSNPINATFAKSTAIGTISNDDSEEPTSPGTGPSPGTGSPPPEPPPDTGSPPSPIPLPPADPNSPSLFNLADFGGINGIYKVGGTPGQAVTLQFDWTFRDSVFNNEIGYFLVDDDIGRINGIAPGDPNFARTALSSSTCRVLFSSGQRVGSGVDLNFNAGDRIIFYIIQNNTTENWLATNPQNNSGSRSLALFSVTGANPDGVNHASNQNTGTNGIQLGWEDQSGGGDRDFNDVVLSVGPGALLVPGTSGQTTPTTFEWTGKQAKFNNEFGLFRVDDATGRIGNLLPGDPGYAAAALGNGNSQVIFARGQNVGVQTSLSLTSGSYVAWYLIQNGTTAQFISQNPGNLGSAEPLVFLSPIAAAPDGVDHLWRLPGEEFAFEDQTGGGDRDFNDLRFRMRFNT